MKILIIGKKGQLASALIRSSESFGIEAVAFGKDELDILDQSSTWKNIKLFKPDFIINTSGEHASEAGEKNPEQLFRINAIAVGNLAKSCQHFNIGFVTISSNYVFDGKKKTPYSETDLPNPIQWYGISKLAGEESALNFCDKSFVIRTTGIFGGGLKGSPQKGNFVLNLIRDSKRMRVIEINNEQKTNVTHANDLANAIFSLLQKNADPGIYNITNRGIITWLEFAKEIVRYANLNASLKGIDKKGFSSGVLRPINSATINTKLDQLNIAMPEWKGRLHDYIDSISNNER